MAERVTGHLHNAAREWEAILRELHPEYTWVATVKNRKRADGHRGRAKDACQDEGEEE